MTYNKSKIEKEIKILDRIDLNSIEKHLCSTSFFPIVQKRIKKASSRHYDGSWAAPIEHVQFKVTQIFVDGISYEFEEEYISINLSIIYNIIIDLSQEELQEYKYRNKHIIRVEHVKIQIFAKQIKHIKSRVIIRGDNRTSNYTIDRNNKIFHGGIINERFDENDSNYLNELCKFVSFRSFPKTLIKDSSIVFTRINYVTLKKFIERKYEVVFLDKTEAKPYNKFSYIKLIIEELKYDIINGSFKITAILYAYGSDSIKLHYISIDFEEIVYASTIVKFNFYRMTDSSQSRLIESSLNEISSRQIPIHFDTLEIYTQWRREFEKRKREAAAIDNKIYLDEIQREDPYGTGGDEPSSSIYD